MGRNEVRQPKLCTYHNAFPVCCIGLMRREQTICITDLDGLNPLEWRCVFMQTRWREDAEIEYTLRCVENGTLSLARIRQKPGGYICTLGKIVNSVVLSWCTRFQLPQAYSELERYELEMPLLPRTFLPICKMTWQERTKNGTQRIEAKAENSLLLKLRSEVPRGNILEANGLPWRHWINKKAHLLQWWSKRW